MGLNEGSRGNKLFHEVMELTGLPDDMISGELKSLLEKTGSDAASMTLDDLRKAVLCYMAEIIGSDTSYPPADPAAH